MKKISHLFIEYKESFFLCPIIVIFANIGIFQMSALPSFPKIAELFITFLICFVFFLVKLIKKGETAAVSTLFH